MVNVGVYGATGYTGFETLRLLQLHPQAALRFAASSSSAGKSLASVLPGAPDLLLISPDQAPLNEIEVAILCLAHGDSARMAAHLLAAGVRVIDLSADFRLADPTEYATWYGSPHPFPNLLAEAVYGLSEFAHQELVSARLVANPGCYPTTVLLGLKPLFDLTQPNTPVIIDAKSGVSGAGRKPTLNTHFVEAAENLKPYNIGRIHRHLPEMEQILARWCDPPPHLVFVPHLLPIRRGMLSTIYVQLDGRHSEAQLREHYQQTYAAAPFVQVLPAGEPATIAHTQNTNRAAIGMHLAEKTLILTVSIDNLLKGAAGQAVQNLNIMFGLEETMGLLR